MSDAEKTEEVAKKKGSKLPILIGFVLALAGGGGGYFATSMGLIGGAKAPESAHAAPPAESEGSAEAAHAYDHSNMAYLPINPVVVNLPPGAAHKHLRFVAQLEVSAANLSAVEAQMPRIVDVLNTYLRALEPADFEDRAALLRIRTHLLARLNVVTGPGQIRDVLIMEYVLT